MRKINIGLIGFGTVGSGVVKVLQERKALLKKLGGVDIALKYICDKDITSNRGLNLNIDKKILTKNPNKILMDPDIEIVIELIGGVYPAREIILAALRNNKHIVTANKALLAEKGAEIFKTAERYGKEVRFEGSVGGGIPIVKALREGFVSNKINEIYGIINGTSNYILSQMSDKECKFDIALKAAKNFGIAEANPKLDVNGTDSAHKLILLAWLSFGILAKPSQVYREGILEIEPRDITYAKEMGYTIKLLAISKKVVNEIELRVHPTLVPNTHLLAAVKDVYNAIYVKGDLTGQALFYGKGAGRFPTASAVVSDIVDLAKIIQRHPVGRTTPFKTTTAAVIKKMDEIKTRYYIRFSAVDRPGVLANISSILGRNNISIASVTQKEKRRVKTVPIVMMTHLALERDLRKAMALIDRLPVIKKKSVVIRVESL
ncbi:MAG: homoserine dehydrogenase [Candidatus Omnitrophica bacterium]|nr:homoserine dehydrogenase [Candidatus Omnitrophota bacterium]